jgi:hypothetical protein
MMENVGCIKGAVLNSVPQEGKNKFNVEEYCTMLTIINN